MTYRSARNLAICIYLATFPTASWGEGTAQLGKRQAVRETTELLVEVLKVGEVINIAVGNDAADSDAAIEVTVTDPAGAQVFGSPFTITTSSKGYLPGGADPAVPAILKPEDVLQITSAMTGSYVVAFDNLRVYNNDPPAVDPLDISVTPNATTNINTAAPFDGLGRLHSRDWHLNSHGFTANHATNAAFYVVVPTSSTTDSVWRMQFEGMAGYSYEVAANDIGLRGLDQSGSVNMKDQAPPNPMFEIYLNIPVQAKGGGQAAEVSNLQYSGPTLSCKCAVKNLPSSFTFQAVGGTTYSLVIDLDKDGIFDPSKGDREITGTAQSGANTIDWDGTTEDGKGIAAGTYDVRLSVRLGQFHFVAKDVETAKPGLRIFAADISDKLNPIFSPTQMFWDDTKVNTKTHDGANNIPEEQKSKPESSLPDGLSSGQLTDPAICDENSGNAHCWGNFENSDDPLSPGENRYMDTWVFSYQTVVYGTVCVDDEATDTDGDTLTFHEECSAGSDPTKADTDDDGLNDAIEVKGQNQTDPTKADTDSDGVGDGVEDADQDGVYDSATETDPTKPDTDGDGLKDGEEDADQDGTKDSGETDPRLADTDGDGLVDGLEQGVDSSGNAIPNANPTDPLKADSDGDGLSDAEEDSSGDGVLGSGETDPTLSDTDGDGLSDGIEKGKNSDGSTIADANTSDALDSDTDDDGLKDGEEDLNANGVFDKATETDPNTLDSDSDGLPDGWIDGFGGTEQNGTWEPGEGEDRNGNGKFDAGTETDPKKKDTDGGGEPDGAEENTTHHNPLDSADDREPTVIIRGGGGCSTAGGTGVISFFTIIGLVFLLLGRRFFCVVGLVLFLLFGASAVAAQTKPVSFPAANFRPAANPSGYFVSEKALTLPHLNASALLYFGYAHQPLKMLDSSSGEEKSALMNYQFNVDLLLAFGLFDRLELALALPVTLAQSSDDLAALDRPPGTTLAPGIGDIRFIPKVRLLTAGVVSFALALPLSLPSGSEDNFLGDATVSFSPRAIIALNLERFRAALNVGYRIRKDQSVAVSSEAQPKLIIDDELFGSLGLSVPVWDARIDLLADFFFSMSVIELRQTEAPVEFLVGARIKLPYSLAASVAGGAGLTYGVGAPKFRIIAGFSYQYVAPRAAIKKRPIGSTDPDLDGFVGAADKCPNSPEDMDGFEDGDGCPEKDNDKDGIADLDDACPLKAEDRDDFEDRDGCPEPDNDKDEILDGKDMCPNEKEDLDGFEDEDGCPDKDNDKDGVVDQLDKCPLKAEDKDGFEDTDGCPELDNDGDGVEDAKDKCPNAKEDLDGWADFDGCPEIDNDDDGMPDTLDKCPDDAEVFNGVDDADGCPDKGPGLVQIEKGRIASPAIAFARKSTKVRRASMKLLQDVTNTLQYNLWIKKVALVGYGDAQNESAADRALAKKRAETVRDLLIKVGVHPLRIKAVDYAEAGHAAQSGKRPKGVVQLIIISPVPGKPTPPR
jgi:outer membrane protein OmpA-like peptidoglycan-associated protein